MTDQTFHIVLQIAGFIQLGMIFLSVAAGRITEKLDVVHVLPPIHRQMYLAYSFYVVLTIAALGLGCIFFPEEIASGKGLGRGVALFGVIFWTGRLLLQFRYDIKPYLRRKWMSFGYHALLPVFAGLVVIYVVAVVR